MSLRGRALASAVVIVLAIGLCAFTILFGRVERGFQTYVDGELVVVWWVLPGSIAERYGVRPGQIVVDGDGRSTPGLQVAIDNETGRSIYFIDREEYARSLEGGGHTGPGVSIGPAPDISATSQELLTVGVLLLLAGMWWVSRQSHGSLLRELALPTAAAMTVPLFVEPARLTQTPLLVAISWTLAAAAVVPFGLAVAGTLADRLQRRAIVILVAGCAGLVVLGALLVLSGQRVLPEPPSTVLLLATAGPGLAAAVVRYSTPSEEGERGRVVPAVELAVAGLTPAFARLQVFEYWGSPRQLLPLAIWILVVTGGLSFAVRPLLRVATRAGVQRDIAVAAMEAERARLAANIHDDALQDLTMLVRRFDAAGDAEGAAVARHIADRLRAICGDLRLPILDDLGTGPALEWLVERVERLAGGEVQLERGDDVRPPAEVELAFFRVAQEALANAVKHGRPPIVVR
nr:hypothetical protein [Chloroflexota bacterium]